VEEFGTWTQSRLTSTGPKAKVIGILEDSRRLDIEAKGSQLCARITTDLLIVGEEV
jgi:hypothetical protein